MLGAGVFSVWGPAVDAAGSAPALLTALAVAGFIAYCNARSTARLAAVHPNPAAPTSTAPSDSTPPRASPPDGAS
ncbi:hypothetical protein GCM10029992_03960 [Glycomyces albus]